VQEARSKIDLRQCITDEVVPLALGSSTEANTMELTTAWNICGSDRNHSSTARFHYYSTQYIANVIERMCFCIRNLFMHQLLQQNVEIYA